MASDAALAPTLMPIQRRLNPKPPRRRSPLAMALGLFLGLMLPPLAAVQAQDPSQAKTSAPSIPTSTATPQALQALPPHRALRLRQGAEQRTFFLLDKDEQVVFSIQGPATVQLISRALFTDGSPVLGYSLWYRLDGGDDQRIDVGGIDVDPTASFVPASSGAPGRALSHRLAVGDGWHSLVLRRQGSAQSVAIRALATMGNTNDQIPWRPLHPIRPPASVELISADGSLGTYFRFNEERGLRFEPTVQGFLRLFVHSEHFTSQTEPFRYQIEVRRDGRPWLLYDLLGERSAELKTVGGSTTPGKVRQLIFRVEPAELGRRSHYLIRPAIGSGRSLLGRADFAATSP